MADLLDAEGEPFVDGAEYVDSFGDTWRAVFEATEFRLVQKADGSIRDGDNVPFMEAGHVAENYGPMVPVAGESRG